MPPGAAVSQGDEALYARARRPMPPPPPEKRKSKRQAQPACRLLDQPIQNFERRIKTNDVDPMILALFVSRKSKVRSVMLERIFNEEIHVALLFVAGYACFALGLSGPVKLAHGTHAFLCVFFLVASSL